MDKKRKKFILLTIAYEVILFAACLLLSLCIKEHTEAMITVSTTLFCILGLPLIIANESFYHFFSKDYRKKLKEEKEETKRKNELLRIEYDLPDFIETHYESKLFTKPRLIVAMVLLLIGVIITFGSGIIFSFLEYENFILEIIPILFGLAIIVYSFFIAFKKPFWGLIHSAVPIVSFSALPIVLYANKVIQNSLILVLLSIIPGIAIYSIFMILTVVIPKKRIKIATDSYIKEFEMKNKGYKYNTFSGGLHSGYFVTKWFYNRINGKKITIFTDDETSYLVVSSNLRYGKYLLEDVPILFEKNVEDSKNIIKKIIDE